MGARGSGSGVGAGGSSRTDTTGGGAAAGGGADVVLVGVGAAAATLAGGYGVYRGVQWYRAKSAAPGSKAKGVSEKRPGPGVPEVVSKVEGGGEFSCHTGPWICCAFIWTI